MPIVAPSLSLRGCWFFPLLSTAGQSQHAGLIEASADGCFLTLASPRSCLANCLFTCVFTYHCPPTEGFSSRAPPPHPCSPPLYSQLFYGPDECLSSEATSFLQVFLCSLCLPSGNSPLSTSRLLSVLISPTWVHTQRVSPFCCIFSIRGKKRYSPSISASSGLTFWHL